MRLSSPEVHGALLQGLTDAGADVYDLGQATTPYVYYATAAKGFMASVQITASHNPKDDNGLKVSRENALPVGYDAGLGTIEKWIKEGRPCIPVDEASRGKVIPLDLREEYLAFDMRGPLQRHVGPVRQGPPALIGGVYLRHSGRFFPEP